MNFESKIRELDQAYERIANERQFLENKIKGR